MYFGTKRLEIESKLSVDQKQDLESYSNVFTTCTLSWKPSHHQLLFVSFSCLAVFSCVSISNHRCNILCFVVSNVTLKFPLTSHEAVALRHACTQHCCGEDDSLDNLNPAISRCVVVLLNPTPGKQHHRYSGIRYSSDLL